MTKRCVRLAVLFFVLIAALSVSAFADELSLWYAPSELSSELLTGDAPSAAVIQEQPTAAFPDVQQGDWFYADVMKLYQKGVIGGFPDGSFRPSATVTTGQALKMILLASGHPEPETADSHWARGYLNYAIDHGFLVRFQDISDLDIPISRALTAKLAANALGLEREDQTVQFSDTDDDHVCALTQIGVIGGYPDGTYRPNNELTRAELSAICSRILTYLAPPADSNELIENQNGEEDVIELRTSEKGVQFIKEREGFVKYAMWDYAQYSIGYGSRCDKDEYPDGITEQQADRLLRQNIARFEESVDPFLEKYHLQLSENQYDAIISFSYNLGTNWFRNGAASSNLAALLISGDYTENKLAGAFGVWCHVTTNGRMKILESLITRRTLETQMFLYADYGGKTNAFCYVIYETEKGSRAFDVALYKKGAPYGALCTCSCEDDDFLGWFCPDGTELTEETVVSKNLTVTAKWSGREETPDPEADPQPDPDEQIDLWDDATGDENTPGSWY